MSCISLWDRHLENHVGWVECLFVTQLEFNPVYSETPSSVIAPMVADAVTWSAMASPIGKFQ
jgi:hypothetical protein